MKDTYQRLRQRVAQVWRLQKLVATGVRLEVDCRTINPNNPFWVIMLWWNFWRWQWWKIVNELHRGVFHQVQVFNNGANDEYRSRPTQWRIDDDERYSGCRVEKMAIAPDASHDDDSLTVLEVKLSDGELIEIFADISHITSSIRWSASIKSSVKQFGQESADFDSQPIHKNTAYTMPEVRSLLDGYFTKQIQKRMRQVIQNFPNTFCMFHTQNVPTTSDVKTFKWKHLALKCPGVQVTVTQPLAISAEITKASKTWVLECYPSYRRGKGGEIEIYDTQVTNPFGEPEPGSATVYEPSQVCGVLKADGELELFYNFTAHPFLTLTEICSPEVQDALNQLKELGVWFRFSENGSNTNVEVFISQFIGVKGVSKEKVKAVFENFERYKAS